MNRNLVAYMLLMVSTLGFGVVSEMQYKSNLSSVKMLQARVRTVNSLNNQRFKEIEAKTAKQEKKVKRMDKDLTVVKNDALTFMRGTAQAFNGLANRVITLEARKK